MDRSAIALYANDETRNGQSFPRTHFDLNTSDHPKFFTNWNQAHSFGNGAPESNDITAAFYLLYKTQDLDPQTMVCPETKHKAMRFGDQKPKPTDPVAASRIEISNFPGMDYVSYSIENMYPSKEALITGWKWNPAIPVDIAILADLNPGGAAVTTTIPSSSGKELEAANSPNHAGAGQNVMYGDLHVEWTKTPFCGGSLPDGTRDNIYCRRAGAAADPVVGPSMDKYDSILLPAAK